MSGLSEIPVVRAADTSLVETYKNTAIDKLIIQYIRRNMHTTCSGCTANKCGDTKGCPDNKDMPSWLEEWNLAVTAYRENNRELFLQKIKEAWKVLSHSPLTAVTGRICPAPCQGDLLPETTTGCVEQIGGGQSVSIKTPERIITDIAWQEGWVATGFQEKIPKSNGKKIAVIGSGPAGYAMAWKLAQDGFQVTVYEKDKHVGGLMTYGIPDAKLPQDIVAREWKLLTDTGRVIVHTDQEVSYDQIRGEHDEVAFASGKPLPMELVDNDRQPIEGRDLPGVDFAINLLHRHQEVSLGERGDYEELDVQGEDVLVLGAGDSADDTVHTSNLLRANSVDMAIRKTQEDFEATKPSPCAYSPKQIGKHDRRWGTVVTKIEETEEGRKLVHFKTTTDEGEKVWTKEYGKVLNAYGFQKSVGEKVGEGNPNITRKTRGAIQLVDETFVAGDAAHMTRAKRRDLVVSAIADGVEQTELIKQKFFPGKKERHVATFFKE